MVIFSRWQTRKVVGRGQDKWLRWQTQSEHRYECCRGRVGADETPLGWMPDPSDIDLEGLDYERAKLAEALKIDVKDCSGATFNVRRLTFEGAVSLSPYLFLPMP
jgi:GTP-dependent phosphoenolpyruvate carboxykinase